MKQINLINSDKIVIVDDEDFEELSQYKWRLNKKGYITRRKLIIDDKNTPTQISIHRQIMNVIIKGKCICIDHINHNKLDNRKENLRICTSDENAKNLKIESHKNINSTSKFKGVYYSKKIKKWGSGINFNKRKYFAGYFESEEQAALSYDQMARYFFKEFACLNFPDREENIVNIEKIINYKKYKSSKCFGIYFEKERQKWRANVIINKKYKYVGFYKTELEAVKARNKYIIDNNLYEENILNTLEETYV